MMPRHRRLWWVVIVALGAGFAWQWLRTPGAPVPVAQQAGVAGNEVLRLGQLVLRACEIGSGDQGTARAYCATFEVPEDWRQPQARKIALKVAVVRSEAATPEADLVAFLDGGPGGAATEDYPAYAGAFAPLLRRRHLLLIDQRGTGDSNALSCTDDDPPLPEPATAAQDNGVNRAATIHRQLRQCLQRLQSRADARFYSTTETTRDLEAVRQALGGPLLNLVGVSYGTRVAQQYITRYPQAVRSAVLDSAVPNELALGSEHARNLEQALQARFASCVATPACRQRFNDPYASLQKLRRQLQSQPQTVLGRDPLSYLATEHVMSTAELAAVVRLYAYSPLTAALLPLTLEEALQGNFSPLLGQAKLLTDVVSERLTDGVGLSVVCTEDVDLLRINPQDEPTLLGNSLVEYMLAACEVWPHGVRPADFHAPFQSALPVLVLAGEHDPVTPSRYGAAIVQRLPQGRLLIAPGQGHAVMGAGCMPQLVARFVQQLDAGLEARCLNRLGDVPAFTSYNGAAP